MSRSHHERESPVWACQYHVVFIPKYRKKVIYTELRRYLGDVLRRLAQRRETRWKKGT